MWIQKWKIVGGYGPPSEPISTMVDSMECASWNDTIPLILLGDWNCEKRRDQVDQGRWNSIETLLDNKNDQFEYKF